MADDGPGLLRYEVDLVFAVVALQKEVGVNGDVAIRADEGPGLLLEDEEGYAD